VLRPTSLFFPLPSYKLRLQLGPAVLGVGGDVGPARDAPQSAGVGAHNKDELARDAVGVNIYQDESVLIVPSFICL